MKFLVLSHGKFLTRKQTVSVLCLEYIVNMLQIFIQDESHCPTDVLFCETVLVPPTKYRPMRIFKGDKYENPQSVNLRKLLEANETIRAIFLAKRGSKDKALLVIVKFVTVEDGRFA